MDAKEDMNDQINSSAIPVSDWRIKLGTALFVLSIFLPVAGIPLVTTLGLSTTMTASVSGVLLVGGEVIGVCAIAVMGKVALPS